MNRSPSHLRTHPKTRRTALKAASAAKGGCWRGAVRTAPQAFLEARQQDGTTSVTPGPDSPESHRPSPAPGAVLATKTTPETSAAEPKAGLRVLLAEDDPMVARSTIAVLRRLGHSVTHALDGSSAWRSLQNHMHEFDVLLLDVVMPRMNGSDLAHRARAAGFAGPIILVSGLVMEIDPDALALLGIRKFMTKPFMPADLDRALRGA